MGNTPLICGGRIGWRNEYKKSCYSLKEDGDWNLEASANLNTARALAANGHVIMNNKLVIAGGWSGRGLLDTIEVVASNTKAETLSIRVPVALSESCIVPWDHQTFMIIGGVSGNRISRETYFINMDNNKITNGPSLQTGRYIFACNTINVNGEDYILVAGGGGSAALNTTEYISKVNYEGGWKKSKNWTVI